MSIPKSFNEFTVGQFQSWHKIVNEFVPDSEFGALDLEYQLIAMFLGISFDECQKMKFKDIDPLIKKINKLKDSTPKKKVKRVIVVDKKPYLAIVSPSKLRHELNADQFTSAQTFAQTEASAIENMHNLLALMYMPYKFRRPAKVPDNIQPIAEKMKLAKIGDVYGAVFFYSVVFKRLQETFNTSFQKSNQVLMSRMEELAEAHGLNFQAPTDGIIQ